MTYLLPYLEYPANAGSFYTDAQAIGMAIQAYICTLIFTFQLAFAIYNTWMYLIKQGKWRVFSLTMFYALSINCICLRILVSFFCVEISEMLNAALTLYPAIVKICIGIVQIAVMFEISVRIKESLSMMNSIAE